MFMPSGEGSLFYRVWVCSYEAGAGWFSFRAFS